MTVEGASAPPESLADQTYYHLHSDPHRRESALSDIILGGQDGLVNVLGVILGVAAATANTSIVLVAGLAATFAESISMGAVAYTSTMADAAIYESERAREYRHVRRIPELERQEIRELYSRKGFSGELLDRTVEMITQHPDVWVAVMLAEEHHLTPVSRARALRAAWIVGGSAVVGSLIPLLPFVALPVGMSIWISIVVAALTLFAVGAYKARLTVGRPARSGLEMAIIGTVSALAGYAVGLVLRVPVTP